MVFVTILISLISLNITIIILRSNLSHKSSYYVIMIFVCIKRIVGVWCCDFFMGWKCENLKNLNIFKISEKSRFWGKNIDIFEKISDKKSQFFKFFENLRQKYLFLKNIFSPMTKILLIEIWRKNHSGHSFMPRSHFMMFVDLRWVFLLYTNIWTFFVDTRYRPFYYIFSCDLK